jgi:hypothetical protein
MPRSPGEQWACEACGKKLIAALTNRGNVAPIEVEPSAVGNVLLHRRSIAGKLTPSAWVLGPEMADYARENDVELRLNHFATCPERDRFKRST